MGPHDSRTEGNARQAACARSLSRGPRAAAILALLLAGCTVPQLDRWADRAGNRAVDAATAEIIAPRREQVLVPGGVTATAAPAAGERERLDLPVAAEKLVALSLRDALSIATRNNREYKAQRESLFLQGLSLDLARHDFGPIVNSTLNALLGDGTGTPRSVSESGSIGVSDTLPFGGELQAALSGRLDQTVNTTGGAGTDPSTASSAVDLSLSQPLLRGFGKDISHERLIQAERDILYAVRAFELFREDFTIDLMQAFYGLVALQETVKNQRDNLAMLEFQAQKTHALYEVGRQNLVEALRAENAKLDAQNSLIGVEEQYQNALDSFKIQLGLPVAMSIDVAAERPAELRAGKIDFEEAARCALANRLDLPTSRDRIGDRGRAVAIAENAVLPDLDLGVSYALDAPARDDPGDLNYSAHSYNVSLALALPTDRYAERNALAGARIAKRQSERQLSRDEDQVVNQIRAGLRRLERAEIAIQIARQAIQISEREVKRAAFLLEVGEIDNRDWTQAQNSLTQAKNDEINRIVDYEIARVQLLRDLGILFLDDDGVVKE